MSQDQHVVQNHNIYIGNKSFERVEHFSYLGTSLTNQLQIAVREYLLLFGAEFFVFLFSVQKYKGPDIWNYNFPFVLYGCDTWSPTVSEAHRLGVFWVRELRNIFGPTRDKVTGEWGRWHGLHSSNFWVIKWIMRWAGHVANMGKSRGAYRILVGRPEGRRPLGRPRLRLWDTKIDLQEVVWGHWLDWSGIW